MTFVRSFSWKEWLGLMVIVSWHVASGRNYGPVGLVIGLLLGVAVGVALVMAFRILSQADRRKKDSKQGPS